MRLVSTEFRPYVLFDFVLYKLNNHIFVAFYANAGLLDVLAQATKQ